MVRDHFGLRGFCDDLVRCNRQITGSISDITQRSTDSYRRADFAQRRVPAEVAEDVAGRDPSRRSSRRASRYRSGTAYAQRKIAAVDGETCAARTRMLENAMVSAPAIAISWGRSVSRLRTPPVCLWHRSGHAPVRDRHDAARIVA